MEEPLSDPLNLNPYFCGPIRPHETTIGHQKFNFLGYKLFMSTLKLNCGVLIKIGG